MKYKLGESREFDGITLHRVVSLVAIASAGVSPGDVGGWIQREGNLSQVSDEAWVSDEARVSGEAWVSGKAQVSGEAWVSGKAQVSGEAQVSGKAWVSGKAQVRGSLKLEKTSEYMVIGPIGSRSDWLTIATDYAAVGCFTGTWDQFLSAVASTHEDNKHAPDYRAAIAFARAWSERNPIEATTTTTEEN